MPKDRVLPSQIVGSDRKTNTYHLLFRAEDVPSLGYEVLHAVPAGAPRVSDVKASALTIENATLRVTVDPKTDASLRSTTRRRSSRPWHPAAAATSSRPSRTHRRSTTPGTSIPARSMLPPTKLDKADSVSMTEHGPLRATIRVTRTWQSSKFVQDITLYAGSDHVVVSNDIDWHETPCSVEGGVPAGGFRAVATYEIPYGTIERPTTRNNSVEKAKFEVPALRWADLGDGQHGFSLINESKYGYDAVGNVLRLTLLRSPTWPDPDADQGHHHFSYALYPHSGRLEAGAHGPSRL